jgi:hypothetical protein
MSCRKYIKKIEEEEKWKCLSCDPTEIRAARADYWAIHKYHKDRAAKTGGKATPNKLTNGAGQPNGRSGRLAAPSPVRGRMRPPRGGMVVRPGSQFVPSQGPPARVNNGPAALGNGGKAPLPVAVRRIVVPTAAAAAVSQPKKHFVDAMLLEADRTVNRFRSLVNEIRRSWFSAPRDDKTVTLATRKIREAFVAARASLDTADMKVIDIYRTNLDEADMRDIDPAVADTREEQRLAHEEQIFARSELVDQNGIVESLETTPDLPFRKVAP